MAVYRVDQYGRTYYGPNPDLPNYDEQVFESYSIGYEGIYLEWAQPSGTYTGFALVASKEGYPRTIEDGTLLLEAGASAPTFFIDNDVVPGRFHYYSMFLEIQGIWLRAGTSSTLHVKNFDMVRWLWYRIPIHHRLLQGSNLTVDADSNETMLRFISMLGYGLDRIRSSMEAALLSTDLRTTHISTVKHRAKSLGIALPEGLDAAQERILAMDGAYLAANRGLPNAMRAAGRAASGWDMDLRPTYNILPSYDMAEQINPTFPDWDASIRYTVGTVVRTDLHLYRCAVAAYGLDQAPPGNGSNNTWWVVHSEVRADTVAYDSTLLTQGGWAGVSKTAGVADTLVVPKIGIGVPHPVTGDLDANCLTVHNTHSSAVSVSAYSLPANATNDPLINIGHGIILPRIKPWDKTRFYQAEVLVEHKGQVWRAIRQSINKEPSSSSSSWKRNSTDKRLRLTLSGYTHQAHGTAQAVAPVTPYISWFDEFGKLIGTVTATSTADSRVLDTFTTYPGTNALAPLAGRTTEFGGKTWSSPVTGFIRDSYDDGSARPSTAGQRCMSVIDYGNANAVVATTVATAPTGGLKQGLVLRVVDSSNYFRATRTALERVQAGTVNTLATYGTAAVDGDRITVTVTGNNFTVQVNGNQVATATDAFQNTATKFGIVVEA
ncbi:hypothetical protein AB0K16_22480 [Nonomuraea jabiensis]|uniref:hypothetical protein n=1 Tax=Nonomuraea jabiensis TaxID=882448 RepID=UPI003416FADF